MITTLTLKQEKVKRAIEKFIETNGYAPTYAQIGKAVGLSLLATVHKHIQTLKKKGHILHEYNKSASLQIAPGPPLVNDATRVRCPHCQQIFVVGEAKH